MDFGDFPAGTVTLGGNAATSPSFAMYSVAVVAQGEVLAISGTPVTSITQGLAYSFVPTISGCCALTFSINTTPPWANFDAGTGALTGTPGGGDVGTTAGIVISVSNGPDSVSLAAFDLTVLSSALGSVTLSWTPPTENADTTPLTDLDGYNIYYGLTVGNYPNSITLATPGIVMAPVGNLSPGTWFFVVTAFDTSNNESEFSNVASKTIAP